MLQRFSAYFSWSVSRISLNLQKPVPQTAFYAYLGDTSGQSQSERRFQLVGDVASFGRNGLQSHLQISCYLSDVHSDLKSSEFTARHIPLLETDKAPRRHCRVLTRKRAPRGNSPHWIQLWSSCQENCGLSESSEQSVTETPPKSTGRYYKRTSEK